jgi:PPK2 family polyphosphate:nucleotide phosphotransferase
LIEPVASQYLVPFDGGFQVRDTPTKPGHDAPGKKECAKRLEACIGELDRLQRTLYAQDRYSALLIFQAMDAAGKDGTIRAVMSGINPTGCQVFSFKQPSREELDHDFLWRTAIRLPERGRIGVFNRSYYEEVLVVRVHPEFLASQRLPATDDLDALWEGRYRSIREHEEHLARNGTLILKFWLNVSRDEQRQRFLARIDEPDKNWKFSEGDVKERRFWPAYMSAYEDALNATSRSWAPWYAIPADDKHYMRLRVAEILVAGLQALELKEPQVTGEQRATFGKMREILQDEEA